MSVLNSRAWRLMIAAACAVSVAMATSPGSAHHSCEPETIYKYCGDHVPASRLPLKFSYVGGGPSGTSTAISAAMMSWNLAWPGNKVGCNPLCLQSGGTSTIQFGSTAVCGGNGSAVARSCFTYDPPNSDKIKKVDIYLKSGLTWRVAGVADLAGGETTGATWGNIPGANWYDVQSVLTHELGHALGLEHIGNTNNPFPSDLTDAWKYQESMYQWYFPGSTSPRTLGAGDIAGLYRVAIDTYADDD